MLKKEIEGGGGGGGHYRTVKNCNAQDVESFTSMPATRYFIFVVVVIWMDGNCCFLYVNVHKLLQVQGTEGNEQTENVVRVPC